MPAQVILSSLTPLLTALEENLHRHIAFVQRSVPGMKVVDDKDLLVVDSGLPLDTFNKVCRTRLSESTADRRIGEVVEYFRGVQRPFNWWVGPGSRPLNLESRLEAHGLQPSEAEVGMEMELKSLPARAGGPSNLVVRRVGTIEELTEFSSVFAANWDPPDQAVFTFFASAAPLLLKEECPMRFFVGYLDREPVAASELFLGAAVAGLYAVATRREFRRRGIGTALSWTAADEARREGISIMILQSSEEGKGVYARLGFRACCHFTQYAVA